MPYTEVQKRGGKEYQYRVRSVRKGNKVSKKRVFLGSGLSGKALARREQAADRELGDLNGLLTESEREFLEDVRRRFAKEPKVTRQNRYEAFSSLFTYDSNAIEGNTLTLQETSLLLFEGLAPAKSTREINEALNHKRALDYLLSYRGRITKRLILNLHKTVVRDTLPPEFSTEAGRYRTVQVHIRGVEWVPAKPKDVPKDMRLLLEWCTKSQRKLHPVVAAAYFHSAFELIHPFVDGNGRVGRLLLNLMLHQAGLPMVNIPSQGRREYFDALQRAQVGGDLRPFVAFLVRLYGEPGPRF
jgi:cell filamentation protein, protein adenylyltransferase